MACNGPVVRSIPVVAGAFIGDFLRHLGFPQLHIQAVIFVSSRAVDGINSFKLW